MKMTELIIQYCIITCNWSIISFIDTNCKFNLIIIIYHEIAQVLWTSFMYIQFMSYVYILLCKKLGQEVQLQLYHVPYAFLFSCFVIEYLPLSVAKSGVLILSLQNAILWSIFVQFTKFGWNLCCMLISLQNLNNVELDSSLFFQKWICSFCNFSNVYHNIWQLNV